MPRRGEYFRWQARWTVESHLRLDIRPLARLGLLWSTQPVPWRWSTTAGNVTVFFRATEDHLMVYFPPTTENPHPWQRLDFTATTCHYGGQRYWWVCPDCERRAALLYLDGEFRCRRCQKLAYWSTRANPRDRLREQVAVLREKLGVEPSDTFTFPTKPPRMHWSTFTRLRDRLLEAEQRYFGVLQAQHAAFVARHQPD